MENIKTLHVLDKVKFDSPYFDIRIKKWVLRVDTGIISDVSSTGIFEFVDQSIDGCISLAFRHIGLISGR